MAARKKKKPSRPMKTLGDAEFLKTARAALDLTQTQLAEAMGMTKSSKSEIYRKEKGERPLSPAQRLAVECLLRRADKWPLRTT